MGHPKDLTGQKFGSLTAVEPTGRKTYYGIVWRCRCECGGECEVVSAQLNAGKVRECAACREPGRSGPRDRRGEKWGLLTIVDQWRSSDRTVARCACECGGTTVAQIQNIVNGNTSSCGCLRYVKMDLTGQRRGRFWWKAPTATCP